MHVVMMIDGQRLHREHGMLRRLAIGLISEGLELTRIVPHDMTRHDIDEDEQKLALANRIAVEMSVMPWLRGRRRRLLVEQLEKSPPDVIYAIGRETWRLAVDIGREFESPVALDVWSADELRGIPVRRHGGVVGAYVAATEPLAEAVRSRIHDAYVSTVHYGVAPPTEIVPPSKRRREAVGIGIIGSGRDIASYRALLHALGKITSEWTQFEVFLELRGPHEHEIWKHVQRLGLLERVSCLPDAAHHRVLLVQCDAMVMPERCGEARSLTMEAMAHGIPVVASEDRWLDYLIADETAAIVDGEDVDEWAECLRRVLRDGDEADRLARGARQWIQARHQSSQQASKLTEVLWSVQDAQSHPIALSGHHE